MLILLPFHREDADKAAALMELCSKLERVTDHQLILLYPQHTGSELVEKVDRFARQAFAVVHKHPIPHDVPTGWPKGPNAMFVAGTAAVQAKLPFEASYNGDYRLPNGAFLWLEPDTVPLGAGWLSRLQAEYHIAQKPFLGTVRPTLIQDVIFNVEGDPDSGIKEKLRKRIEGEHMVLVGMYDRQLLHHINWLGAAASGHDPVDVVIQNETCQKDTSGQYTRLQNTSLIGHGWHTHNYRITQDSEITILQADGDADNTGDNIFQFHRRGYQGPCMIHGCKDNSLIECVEYINGLRDMPPLNAPVKFEASVEKLHDLTVRNLQKREYPNQEFAPLGTVEAIIKEGAVIGYKEQNMQSSPLNEPEHDADELTPAEQREFMRLMAKVERKSQIKVAAKKKTVKVKAAKSAAKDEVDENEVWAFYQKESATNGGKAWQNTLKRYRISARQLSSIRKSKESLQPA